MHTDDKTTRALAWLARDPLFYIDMTEPLKRGIAHVVAAGDEGVLLRLDDAPVYLHAAVSREEALRLAILAEAPELMVAHQEAFLGDVMEAAGLTLMMTCHQCVCPGGGPLPVEAPGFAFRLLGPEWAPFVEKQYNNPVGIEYLEHQLERGLVWGGFAVDESGGEEIAGFVGEHGEGSLGMLEVLPAYRRRGLGKALQAVAANGQLQRGCIPFTQVTVGNTASIRLQESLGFRIAEGNIFWLEDRTEIHTTW